MTTEIMPESGFWLTSNRPAPHHAPRFEESVLTPGALRTLFQPIVSLGTDGWSVRALECLTRGPAGTHFEGATTLFATARAFGLVAQLDQACITTALGTVLRSEIPFPLFVNVDAETLITDRGFPTFLAAMAAGCDVPWSRITLEITEHARALDIVRLACVVRELKDIGMRVAFDDFGPSESDAMAIEICEPDVVKIEGSLLGAARYSSSAHALLERVVTLAGWRGATIVAEGLERPSDLDVAQQLGIGLLQGHLLCRPLAADVARFADAHVACWP